MKKEFTAHLPGDFPWQNQIYWFETIGSTNTEAAKMARAGAPHGTILIAEHQTAGRGRMGRTFQSPGGMGVYMSIILRPQVPVTELMHLTCAAAWALCDAVERAAGLEPGIKWTNDLVIDKRKIAGILTELSVSPATGNADYVIIGAGINCCQREEDFDPEIRSIAGSLAMAAGRTISRGKLAAAMAESMHRMDQMLLTDKDTIMEHYRRKCITLGQDISLVRGEEVRHGHAVDIDPEGALTVRFPDGHLETVSSGEVSVRGMYGYV